MLIFKTLTKNLPAIRSKYIVINFVEHKDTGIIFGIQVG